MKENQSRRKFIQGAGLGVAAIRLGMHGISANDNIIKNADIYLYLAEDINLDIDDGWPDK